MNKEWLRGLTCTGVELSGRPCLISTPYWLTPRGRKELSQIYTKLITGEKFSISEQTGVLDGYTLNNPQISQDTRQLLQKCNYLAIPNHFSACPAGIVGSLIYFNRCMKELTNKEVKTVLGWGFSLVASHREEISQTTGLILTDKGSLEINRELAKGETVAIFPEGRNSHQLKKGNFKTGRFLLHVAEMDNPPPIVPVGLWFENRAFSLKVGDPVDRQKIKEIGYSVADKKESGQKVIDYVMSEHLVPLLPRHLEGKYKNKQ